MTIDEVRQLAVIGECLIELTAQDDGRYRMDYAGDTFNTAVYAKRSDVADIDIQYVTALGDDTYSERIRARCQEEAIGTDYIRSRQGHLPGLYLVQTDMLGERSFDYYRESAPVRTVFDEAEGADLLQRLSSFSAWYVSGISLAVLLPESRSRFLEALTAYANKGGIVIFDTNYRARLWSSVAEAQAVYDHVWPCVTLALPSLGDMSDIYQKEYNYQTVIEKLSDQGVAEVVVTAGAQGSAFWADDAGPLQEVPAHPVEAVVDTTGAGDAFHGAYVAARMSGAGIAESVNQAVSLAAVVVQHPGAIIER